MSSPNHHHNPPPHPGDQVGGVPPVTLPPHPGGRRPPPPNRPVNMPQLGVFPVIPAGTPQLRPYRSDLQLRQEEHPRPQRPDPQSLVHLLPHPSGWHVTRPPAEPRPLPLAEAHPLPPAQAHHLRPAQVHPLPLAEPLDWTIMEPPAEIHHLPAAEARPPPQQPRNPPRVEATAPMFRAEAPPFQPAMVLAEVPPFQPAEQAAAAPPEHASPQPEQPSPRPTSAERRSSERPSHNNYVENPRVTFLLEDALITCEICYESELILTRPHATIRDSTPAIFPCGHVFGLKCINEWLESHSTCPTCRLELRHKKCGHPVKAGPIHTLNVMKIPRTIPRGGLIEGSCGKCWNRMRQEEARRVYESVSGFIGTGLAGSRGVFGEETHAAMVERAKEFADGLVEDCIGEPRGQWWQ